MATWKELDRYCKNDGWMLYKETDHLYYMKVLEDGRILRTKVSKGTGEIGKHLFQEILKKQLETNKEHFNKMI